MFSIAEVGRLVSYDFVTAPVVFELPDGVEAVTHAIAPDASKAVYATSTELTCVDRDGRRLWAMPCPSSQTVLDLESETSYLHAVTAAFSPDGNVLWLYRPDRTIGSGLRDTWRALDADTGTVLAEYGLDCVGRSGYQFVHPDGVHVLLNVDEGDAGSRIYRGRLAGSALQVVPFPWTDRGLIGLTRDGTRMMTVDEGQSDVAFHTCPDGVITGRVYRADFGTDREAFIEWMGGFLDGQTAVVILIAEDDDDWQCAYLVDARTARVIGPLEPQPSDPYDFELLGDGTWVTTGYGDTPTRHTRA